MAILRRMGLAAALLALHAAAGLPGPGELVRMDVQDSTTVAPASPTVTVTATATVTGK